MFQVELAAQPPVRDHPGVVGHARLAVVDPRGHGKHRPRRARAGLAQVPAGRVGERGESGYRILAHGVVQQRHVG